MTRMKYLIESDPMDYKDFGAEVELYLGEEGEKHLITQTTFVYVPKELIHYINLLMSVT